MKVILSTLLFKYAYNFCMVEIVRAGFYIYHFRWPFAEWKVTETIQPAEARTDHA